MANFIKWNQSVSVQQELLDKQHKQIYDHINKLHAAIMEKSVDKALTISIMNNIENYTNEHFSTEEKLLAACNYPGLEEHKLIHQKMSKKTAELAQEIRQIRGTDAQALLLFLKDWWQQHILKTDMKYVPLSKWS